MKALNYGFCLFFSLMMLGCSGCEGDGSSGVRVYADKDLSKEIVSANEVYSRAETELTYLESVKGNTAFVYRQLRNARNGMLDDEYWITMLGSLDSEKKLVHAILFIGGTHSDNPVCIGRSVGRADELIYREGTLLFDIKFNFYGEDELSEFCNQFSRQAGVHTVKVVKSE